jgi:glycerate kinase
LRVVIAPDSFKGSIGAAGAAAALAGGWHAVRPGDEVVCVPLADGGEGTLDVLAAAVSGARWHQARVTGPAGQPVDSAWLELPGGLAAVELARASGLPLLARPDPLGAQTTGLGQVIGHALDAGAGQVIIALGGSASTDGGTGALAALGARFLDAAGVPLPPGGGALAGLDKALAGAGLVITGEGRYDETSATGKVAGTVFAAAAAAGVPAALVAGQVAAPPPPGVRSALGLADLAGGPGPALADPARWLGQAGQKLARLIPR